MEEKIAKYVEGTSARMFLYLRVLYPLHASVFPCIGSQIHVTICPEFWTAVNNPGSFSLTYMKNLCHKQQLWKSN